MISKTLIFWLCVLLVFGIGGLQFYKDNKKIKSKKKFKPSQIIHYNNNGRYACNDSIEPVEEKLTEDWLDVTCKNCHNTKFYT